MSTITSLSASQLRAAAELKDKIHSLETQLSQLLGSVTKPAAKSAVTKAVKIPSTRKKPVISAAGIAKIRAAQKARWAKIKEAQSAKAAEKVKVAKPAKTGSKKMSAGAKAKLSAKMKALWAARKAAKK